MEAKQTSAAESPNKKDKVLKTLKQSKDNVVTIHKLDWEETKKQLKKKIEYKQKQKYLHQISPMAKAAPGNITGPVFLIFGLIILGICLGFGSAFYFIYHREILFILLIFLIPFIFSVFLLYLGIKQNIHADTYATYRVIFKKQPYASISELSELAHQSESKVARNLRQFKNEGCYPEGYFIQNDKYFVLSEGAQELLEENLKIENKEKIKNREITTLKEEYPKLYNIYEQISEARTEISSLKKVNSALRKEQLEDDLAEMDYNLKQIQTYILKKPDQVPDLRNFLDYFLPTVVKLLNTYCELDRVKIRTDNIIESQNEIEEVLKTVNKAFKNMYNDFYTGTAMDVYADIQVLKTMISKHGLKESDFEEIIDE